jgi:hypothetical protein
MQKRNQSIYDANLPNRQVSLFLNEPGRNVINNYPAQLMSRQVSSGQQMSRLQSVQSNFKNHVQREVKAKEPVPY